VLTDYYYYKGSWRQDKAPRVGATYFVVDAVITHCTALHFTAFH